MAKIVLASYIKSMHGHIGNIVIYNCCGRQYARSRVTPRNPDTEAQVFVRRTFGDAVRSWQGLGDDEKRIYNRKARARSISGYNLFISEYMKKRMPVHDSGTCESLSQTYCRPLSPVLLRGTSVSAPLLLLESYNSPPPAMVRDKIPA